MKRTPSAFTWLNQISALFLFSLIALSAAIAPVSLAEAYSPFPSFHCDRMAVKLDGKCGYVDSTGKLVIPCIYDDAWNFSTEGYAKVKQNEKIGIIDIFGNMVIPAEHDDAWTLESSALFAVEDNNVVEIVDRSGNAHVQLLDYAYSDCPGRIILFRNNKCGIILDDGASILPPEYDDCLVIENTAAIAVETNGTWAIWNQQEMIPTDCQILSDQIIGPYLYAKNQSGDYVLLDSHANAYRLSDYNIDELVLPTYESRYGPWRDDVEQNIIAMHNGLYGLLDSTLRYVILPQYDNLRLCGDLVYTEKDGKRCFFDRDGVFFMDIPDACDDHCIYLISEKDSLFPIRVDDKYGFIDRTGNVVIEPQFNDIVGGFSNHICIVCASDGMGLLKDNGRYLLWPGHFGLIRGSDYGYFAYGDSYTIVSADGQRIYSDKDPSLPFSLPENQIFYDQYIVIRQKQEGNSPSEEAGKYGILDIQNGKILLPIIYDAVYPGSWGADRIPWGNESRFIQLSDKLWFVQ